MTIKLFTYFLASPLAYLAAIVYNELMKREYSGCSRSITQSYHNKEVHNMPRPKGSKNKKKTLVGAPVEELIAQRTEARATLEAERDEVAAVVAEQRAKLKELNTEIKKIDKELGILEEQKAAAEAAAAAQAAKDAVQNKVAELMSQGMSLEEIMNKLG